MSLAAGAHRELHVIRWQLQKQSEAVCWMFVKSTLLCSHTKTTPILSHDRLELPSLTDVMPPFYFYN